MLGAQEQEKYINEARKTIEVYNNIIKGKVSYSQNEVLKLISELQKHAQRIFNINITKKLFYAIEQLEIKYNLVPGLWNY